MPTIDQKDHVPAGKRKPWLLQKEQCDMCDAEISNSQPPEKKLQSERMSLGLKPRQQSARQG